MGIRREQAINQIKTVKSHVVILGAGASRASFPKGDRNKKKLPLMVDFVKRVRLAPLLKKTDVEYKGRNFEDVYADLHGKKEYSAICQELEEAIYSYFSGLEISDKPCIYDHLMLSLRQKDVIATFNWDPFLIQAYQRNNRGYNNLPQMVFLHGNVSVGVCHKCGERGINGNNCSICHKLYMPTKLLYPVAKKNYNKDPEISDRWWQLNKVLERAAMVTIFGYGRPTSDVEAISLLKKGWGNPLDRSREQVEIIDRKDRDEKELRNTWASLIHTHHYDIRKDFYESWIAKHPRRSVEAFSGQHIENRLDTFSRYPKKTIPTTTDFEELWNWFDGLYETKE